VAARDVLPSWADSSRVVLQPIVSAPDGRLVGHEASARFPHDADVRRVFARAHEEGYGDLLEAHVLCRALAFPGRPEGSALFVHVGPAALASPRFWAIVPRDLTGVVVELDGGRGCTPAQPDAPGAETGRELLRERGASLAVDDLGGGHGDLGRLLTVRPEIVKVDAALVTGCGTDPVRLQLVEMVVRLAGSTGAQVCAEGVGSAADLDALRGCGVHLVQGPHLGLQAPGWTVVPAGGRLAPAAPPVPAPASA
jgi:EAL domain-containing protein (putative c-di-GMP-specific phosphodiesterase class I)